MAESWTSYDWSTKGHHIKAIIIQRTGKLGCKHDTSWQAVPDMVKPKQFLAGAPACSRFGTTCSSTKMSSDQYQVFPLRSRSRSWLKQAISGWSGAPETLSPLDIWNIASDLSSNDNSTTNETALGFPVLSFSMPRERPRRSPGRFQYR